MKPWKLLLTLILRADNEYTIISVQKNIFFYINNPRNNFREGNFKFNNIKFSMTYRELVDLQLRNRTKRYQIQYDIIVPTSPALRFNVFRTSLLFLSSDMH